MYGTVLTYNVHNSGFNYSREANQISLDMNSVFVYTTAPGSYKLPVKMVNIILPANAEDITTSFTISGRNMMQTGTPVLNTPYSDGEHILTSSPTLQPREHVVFQGQSKWGDVLFAKFAIYPMLYNSNNTGLEEATDITLQVSYNESRQIKPNLIPPTIKKDKTFLNPQALTQWYTESHQRNYDYLIISTPELHAAASALETLHQNQGMVTSFADINTILSSSPGVNPAERVRNYLISQYANAPFSYLMLIGDIDVVPIAYLTPEPNGMDTVPSDFYYSDLTSNFDSDNDELWGEYNSGMDYTPELSVGRIPWNDAATVSQICSRIVSFESGDYLWKRKTLLPAAMLNYANEVQGFERTDGATFMEYCKSNVLSSYDNTTLYEQAGLLPSMQSDYPLTADTLAYLLNTQSYGLVNWSAHGSPTISARKVWAYDLNENNLPETNELQWHDLLGTQTFENMTNQDGAVFFCASCQNGMLDNTTPCLGEVLIKNKAVADIAATRTGWYKIGWANPGWGGLTSYNYHFLENYISFGLSVGQALGAANWLHTQYCLFGDPIDSDGIVWPELQNIYTYLLFGDPAIGYVPDTTPPTGQILIWEPVGNTGNTIVNALHDLIPYNVVYTDHLIDTYNYLNQFDAVFCLFGLGYSPNNYQLIPNSFEYNYLLSYLQQGGKVYMEGMVNWDAQDSLFSRFGTSAPFDHLAYIEHLRYTNPQFTQIWDYTGYNGGTAALVTTGATAQPLFYTQNESHANDIIGVWNRIGNSRTISSSFNLACVQSDLYDFSELMGVILDTLGVYNNSPTPNQDNTLVPVVFNATAGPNPFRQSLTVSAKSDKPVNLSMFNIKGQLIKSTHLLPQGGKVQWQYSGSEQSSRKMPAGIYLIKLDNGHQQKVIKVLKLN
jgi:hypothetical protein